MDAPKDDLNILICALPASRLTMNSIFGLRNIGEEMNIVILNLSG
jgi:hypothetical protein